MMKIQTLSFNGRKCAEDNLNTADAYPAELPNEIAEVPKLLSGASR